MPMFTVFDDSGARKIYGLLFDDSGARKIYGFAGGIENIGDGCVSSDVGFGS